MLFSKRIFKRPALGWHLKKTLSSTCMVGIKPVYFLDFLIWRQLYLLMLILGLGIAEKDMVDKDGSFRLR